MSQPTVAGTALPSTWWQFVGFLGGSTAYALHLVIGVSLVPAACAIGANWPLHLVNWTAIAAILGASVTAERVRRSALAIGASDPSAPARVDQLNDPDLGPVGMPRWRRGLYLAISGHVLNALALAVVLFAEAHVWMLDPCLP